MYAAAALSLALVAASGAGVDVPEPAWSRARSAHFEVLTDAGEPLARHAALRLETLRGVLLQLFPPRIDHERRLVAIVLASGSSFEQLVPRRHQQPQPGRGLLPGVRRMGTRSWLDSPPSDGGRSPRSTTNTPTSS